MKFSSTKSRITVNSCQREKIECSAQKTAKELFEPFEYVGSDEAVIWNETSRPLTTRQVGYYLTNS